MSTRAPSTEARPLLALLRGVRGVLPHGPALRRPGLRTAIAGVAAAILLAAGWLWLRDSSLVAVRTVKVSGIAGPQGAAVRGALEQAARSMTTLHVRRAALDSAVAPFSRVKGLEVHAGFPHTLRIHVVTNVPVAALDVDGRRIPVTEDGTVLRDVPASAGLPRISLRSVPGAGRLRAPLAVHAVAALAAAPAALRAHVEQVETTSAHGLTIKLSNGPALWFGDDRRLAAKWAAAASVLADPDAAGASYIDVSAPEHPAVGGLPDGAPATPESDVPTPPAPAPGTPATTAPATPSQTVPTPATVPSG